MGENLLHQIKNGKPFRFRMEILERLCEEYFVTNNSLYYPEKVVLPLEDFCKFYFKELKEYKIKERINIACNDSMSMCLDTMFEESYGNASAHDKNKTDVDIDSSLSWSYANKFALSRFAVYKYIYSGKSAAELLLDEAYWLRIGHRLFSQCIELPDKCDLNQSHPDLISINSESIKNISYLKKSLDKDIHQYFIIESSKARKTL